MDLLKKLLDLNPTTRLESDQALLDPFFESLESFECFENESTGNCSNAYTKHLRKQIIPESQFLENQQELSTGMRCVLNDWLVEVCKDYEFRDATYFRAVEICDRFLGKKFFFFSQFSQFSSRS